MIYFLHKISFKIKQILVIGILQKVFIISKCVTLKKVVEPGHTMSEYARNVVAVGEMEHQTAGLSDPPRRRVSGCRVIIPFRFQRITRRQEGGAGDVLYIR
jgi:hypothetical protein